jgi:4'-phosphopantetheinyl transferase
MDVSSSIADAVDVWRVHVPSHLGELRRFESLLAADELDRANRFRFATDRQRSIISRGTLRLLIGSYLAAEPRDLAFAAGTLGKPFLAAPRTTLRFNTSHSGDWIVHGFADGDEIGIDIETIRPDKVTAGLAERFFAPAEAAALRELPPQLRAAGFFACWTRKEAYIKALGKGLYYPLDAFRVSVDPREDPALLSDDGPEGGDATWQFYALDVADGMAGCVVVQGRRRKMSRRDLNPACQTPAPRQADQSPDREGSWQ